ncbi:MAG: DUF222 domain-containing protein [bacterium]|nr:DUF222 domain-containing protein [bacterium]MDE0600448.1 DUF222 domain-containing protein [bacterium]
MNTAAANGRGAHEAVVLAPTASVRESTVEQLQARVRSTIRGENQLAGIRAEALAELQRRRGTELTENDLREGGQRSGRQARSEVDTARELEGLPKTLEGLQKGDIPYANARILAGAKKRGDIVEEELLDDARTQSPDRFAARVRKHEQQRSQDDGVSRLEHQRSRRFANFKTDVDDGMTVLYGRFDPVTGARIETALSKKMNELWQEEDPRERATAGQRMADALEILLTRPGGEDGGAQDVRLLVIADYDAVSQQLVKARLSNGTPIPGRTLRKLACDAQILPAIFKGRSQPLDFGTARRKASPTQRAALIARDRACIGCGAKAAWCQAHHIIHWQDEGPTNLDNMCLLCSRCHHNVHDRDWEVHRNAKGEFVLRPPPSDTRRSSSFKTHHRRRRHRRRKPKTGVLLGDP